jgi:hypothetical protein
MFGGDGFLDDFLDAEGGIARGVEIGGPVMQGTLLSLPLVNLVNLSIIRRTTLFRSTSEMFTICPKEGITLMLMLLNDLTGTRPRRSSFGMTSVLIYNYIKNKNYFPNKLHVPTHSNTPLHLTHDPAYHLLFPEYS